MAKKTKNKLDELNKSGQINDFFYKKLLSVGGTNNKDFISFFIRRAIDLTSVGVDSNIKYNIFCGIDRAFEKLGKEKDYSIYSYILNNLNDDNININNTNDYYYLILEAALKNKKIEKRAYPANMGALTDEIQQPHDLASWGKLVNKIYKAVNSGDMTLNNAIDYYSQSLNSDTSEPEDFKKWLSYYKDGEHLKYSDDQLERLSKNALYQFSPHGMGNYYGENKPYEEDTLPDFESLVSDSKKDEESREEESRDSYKTWKHKLNGACRRIDRLLRESEDHCTPEQYEELMTQLHRFNIMLGRLRFKTTAEDLAFKTANNFKKLGFYDGAKILMKAAQEQPVVQQDVAEQTPNLTTEEAPIEVGGEAPPEREMSVAERAAEETEPVPLEELPQIPGAAPNEYDKLAGPVSLADATVKLEEVAGMLADRRVIRYLAEFDIMLDKLGIATMFPELAESQARLIEAYGYALTRVTKMLGMVSSSQTLMDKANGGVDRNDDGVSDAIQEAPDDVAVDTLEAQPEAVEAPTEL